MTLSHRHLLALTLSAFFFGVLCILPNIIQRFDAAYPFQGIEMLGSDQELYYAARVREVFDGHWGLGNVYHADKSLPYAQPPLPEWIMGGLGLALGLGIGKTILLAKWLFGAALFVTMAGFLTRLTDRPWASLAVTAAVLCSWFLFASPWALRDALLGLPLSTEFIRFARLTNPQISLTLFFATLWSLAAWLRTSKKMSLIFAGLFLGLSFYAYPYTWSYLLATIGTLGIVEIAKRQWKTVGWLCALLAIAAVVALPYVLHQHAVAAHQAYASLLERFGLVHTRMPIWGGWLTILVLLGVFAPRRIGKPGSLVFALAAAGAIAMNQQLLTGVTVVPNHYHWYFIHPLSVAFFLLCATAIASRFVRVPPRFVPLLALVALVACFAWGIKFQRDSYIGQRQAWGQAQQEAGVLAALDGPAFRGATVSAPAALSERIPVFSHADVFHATNENIGCLCTTQELQDRYFLELRLAGVSPQEASRRFPDDLRTELSGRIYAIALREQTGSYGGLPDGEVLRLIREYHAFSGRPIEEVLRETPIDAVVIEKGTPLASPLRRLLSQGRRVYGDEWYELWDVR